jgi:Mrp family chromosome partitioning ATPase
MAQLLADRGRLTDAIEQAKQRFGYGEAHPEVAEKRRQLRNLDERIDRYATDYRELQAEIRRQVQPLSAATVAAGATGGAHSGSPSAQELRVHESVIASMYDLANKDVVALGAKRQRIAQLTNESSSLHEELNAVERRLRMLQLESGLGSRLSVVTPGEPPGMPFYNPRKKYAAAGAAAGACAPIGLLVLFGLLGPRYRFSHETEIDLDRSAPLLGILPTLSERLDDLPQAADAAHAVHHIRVMLEMKQHAGRGGVFMITSACGGEGKTNLTVALGLSLVASGRKTLLIDCDLIGQGLTHGFSATSRIGLREALACGTARGLVKKTPKGLRLLTAGNTDTFSGWTLSSVGMSRLIAEARRCYDVVLIDSGPILGSVEASIIAPEVDGVIMMISRGQNRGLVDRAMRHLMTLGAKPLGIVFNRAGAGDFRRAAFHSSARQLASRSNGRPEPAADDISDVASFGPLVRCVATFLCRPARAAG